MKPGRVIPVWEEAREPGTEDVRTSERTCLARPLMFVFSRPKISFSCDERKVGAGEGSVDLYLGLNIIGTTDFERSSLSPPRLGS